MEWLRLVRGRDGPRSSVSTDRERVSPFFHFVGDGLLRLSRCSARDFFAPEHSTKALGAAHAGSRTTIASQRGVARSAFYSSWAPTATRVLTCLLTRSLARKISFSSS